MTMKTKDIKREYGMQKVQLGLVPAGAMESIARVLECGAAKYGAYNWRESGIRCTTYVDAILRHLNAWREGEDLDPESNVSHIAHIAASCCILIDAESFNILHDDRPTGFSWYVTDADGNRWQKCSRTCDMQVVRPGKVQCSCENQTNEQL
jgi:hypothetical protein